MPRVPREMPNVARPTRSDQAACLKAAMDFRGVTIKELAKKMRVSRNSVAAHLRIPKTKRLIVPYYLRKYEQALALPPLALELSSPKDLVGLLHIVPLRVNEPPQAPLQAVPGDVVGTVGFIREQLAGYRRQGRSAVAVTQVEVWLAELEGAAATTPPTAAPAATTSIERVESLKQVEREAAAPSQTPRGRAG